MWPSGCRAAIDEIDGTIREVRSAIFEMDSVRPSSTSLRRDVLDLSADRPGSSGSSPTVQFEGPIDALVPDGVATHLLAVLREALSNVARHAAATHVQVTIRADANLFLEVLDDGTGGAQATTGGNGLRNMVRRAQRLGGNADISPAADRGTRVVWVVPLQAENSRS